MTTEIGQTTTWAIDASHSTVEFSVKHLMFTTVKGRFGAVSGTILENSANNTLSSVTATIEVSSIDTRDEKRDGHLKSPDFFEADTYPTITFKSTSVEAKGGDDFKVVGDLTLKGVTRPVTLDVTRNGEGGTPFGTVAAGFTATTKINRKDFGLTWNVGLETGGVLVGEDIKINLEIEAVKQ